MTLKDWVDTDCKEDESFEYITVGSYNPESGCVEIRLEVTEDFEPGEYIISNIRIYDACYNGTIYTLENDYELLNKTILKVTDKNSSGSEEGGVESDGSGNGSSNENNKPTVEVKPVGNNNTTTGNNSTTNTITNGKGNALPNTGDVVSSTFVLFLGMSSILGGAFAIFKKKEEII